MTEGLGDAARSARARRGRCARRGHRAAGARRCRALRGLLRRDPRADRGQTPRAGCDVTTAQRISSSGSGPATTLWSGSEEPRWLGWLSEPIRMRDHANELLAARAPPAAISRRSCCSGWAARRSRRGAATAGSKPRTSTCWTPHTRARCVRSSSASISNAPVCRLVEVRRHARDALWPRVSSGSGAARCQWLAVTDPAPPSLERLAVSRGFADVSRGRRRSVGATRRSRRSAWCLPRSSASTSNGSSRSLRDG